MLALISMEGSCMVPCMKRRFFQRILMYCVGLGVGTMACAGTLVLIPEVSGSEKSIFTVICRAYTESKWKS